MYTTLLSPRKTEDSTIISISGPVCTANNMESAFMFELVSLSKKNILGEIIKLRDGIATIQIYEDSVGLQIGDIVKRKKEMVSVTLRAGMIGKTFDGIQRDLNFQDEFLNLIEHEESDEYDVIFHKDEGDIVENDEHICSIKDILDIKIFSPFSGKITFLSKNQKINFTEKLCTIDDTHDIYAHEKWPIRIAREKKKFNLNKQMISGIRIMDFFYPLMLGGTACIPGAFGCGKTVLSQSLANNANVDLCIYVGCGERGNEIAELIGLFKKSILIANTSNMPVAARESSIYTGISIAEWYRDMGYDVLLICDSTSRWAEALREISSRLGELPGDRGYPAYLQTRIANFYERAGKTTGSISIVGAVSPPGGDLSCPVCICTLNCVNVFWALDKNMASRKEFPAINMDESFSSSDSINQYRSIIMNIINKANQIREIIKLIGLNSLSKEELNIYNLYNMMKHTFILQNSTEAYCEINKTFSMAKYIVIYYKYMDIDTAYLQYMRQFVNMSGKQIDALIVEMEEYYNKLN